MNINLTKLSVIPLIGYILLMVLLISLGCWQLERAEQKQEYLQKQEQLLQQAPLLLDKNTPDDLDSLKFRSVSVSGVYDIGHQFLLDNQHVNGKVGYFVLTPLQLVEGKVILVNRGWVPLNVNRKILPDISLKQQHVVLSGRINSFPSVGLKLVGADIPTPTWPAIVQVVNPVELGKALHAGLYAFQIELDPAAAEGYVRNWTIPVLITPEKHVAYALQWFGLALTLTVLSFWSIFKKQTNESAAK